MKRALIIAALLLTGCEQGDDTMPLPRMVCTQVTALYSCGRGGTCEQCGNWQIGCPKPLTLTQTTVGKYGKETPALACRLKENDNGVNEHAAPEVATPLR